MDNHLVNGRNLWISEDGEQAIWYKPQYKIWRIGPSKFHESKTADTLVDDSNCPTQNGTRLHYYVGSSWTIPSKNSITLTCL